MKEEIKNLHFKIIENDIIEKVIDTALQLLQRPGVKVYNESALEYLHSAGSEVDFQSRTAKLPHRLVESALKSTPSKFTLHDLKGEPAVFLEGNNFYPYPGTSAICIYDYNTKAFREANSRDLIDFVRLVEQLPYIPVNSSFICKDVPDSFGDIYRLALALKYSKKPIKTSLFTTKDSISVMTDLFCIVSGGEEQLRNKPFGFVSVNADPPLMWNDFITQVLMECAKFNIPLSRGSMCIAGAGAPVTLIGSLIQHTAESLSGIVLSQIIQPGSPGLYGSSPIVFDVRKGTTPMGAIESLMFNAGCARIGKFLGIPTHLYMGLSDAKTIDTQVGFESAMGIFLGALSGVNLCAVGMLNFETALSLENIVIANEIAGNAYRLTEGIKASDEDFNTTLWEEVGHTQGFLGTTHTINYFEREQFKVTDITDRDTESIWKDKGSKDTAQRAQSIVHDLLSQPLQKIIDPKAEEEIDRIVLDYAKYLGLGKDDFPKEFFD
jgi:trimethylamine--corrinoid protein Co-methyltransferase